MSDEQDKAGEKPASADGGSESEKGKDGQPFDAARATALIEKLRAENAAGKATAKELETARARLKEIEDKDKSEVEKLAGTAKEASEKLTAAEARARDLAIRLSVERAARKLSFIDEDDAFRLIDHKAVEMDDDGTPTNIETLLTALAKAKPHLVGQAETNGKATKPVPGTPKPAGPVTKDQEVDNLYQQMRATESAARW